MSRNLSKKEELRDRLEIIQIEPEHPPLVQRRINLNNHEQI